MDNSKNHLKLKTLQQVAEELSISYSTLYRRLKEKNVQLPKGLLSPVSQEIIYEALGCRFEKRFYREGRSG